VRRDKDKKQEKRKEKRKKIKRKTKNERAMDHVDEVQENTAHKPEVWGRCQLQAKACQIGGEV
jgi:hypothetical protein